jgi:hypothetical protein
MVFWILTGVVLALVLGGFWRFDRRHSASDPRDVETGIAKSYSKGAVYQLPGSSANNGGQRF